MASTFTVKSLKGYIDAGFNVAVSGVHGVGKTAKLREACEQLGLKVKYYSASTLDPYTDLTGIPVPNKENRTVEYYRPKDIDEAQVIFFDEINRADPKTINAIFEITQFHTINGEPLPNLKCVIIAMNPVSDEYTTEELDQAFMDRFDVFLHALPEFDLGYFTRQYGAPLAKAAKEFWDTYEANRLDPRRSKDNKYPYISPRRMEKIVATFAKLPSRQTITDALPPEITDTTKVTELFQAFKAATAPPKPVKMGDIEAEIRNITLLNVKLQKSPETGARVAEILAMPNVPERSRNDLLQSIASALQRENSVDYIIRHFNDAVRAMNRGQLQFLFEDWTPQKVSELQRKLNA